MAGASLRINSQLDDRRVTQALRKLQRVGGDMPRAMRDIGEEMLGQTRRRMEQQVDPEGRPWAPLTERYRRRKTRNQDKVLVRRGNLYGRMAFQSGSTWAAVGTPLIYGATHQFGDSDRGIPARPYLGLAGGDRRAVVRIIHDHIRRALRP